MAIPGGSSLLLMAGFTALTDDATGPKVGYRRSIAPYFNTFDGAETTQTCILDTGKHYLELPAFDPSGTAWDYRYKAVGQYTEASCWMTFELDSDHAINGSSGGDCAAGFFCFGTRVGHRGMFAVNKSRQIVLYLLDAGINPSVKVHTMTAALALSTKYRLKLYTTYTLGQVATTLRCVIETAGGVAIEDSGDQTDDMGFDKTVTNLALGFILKGFATGDEALTGTIHWRYGNFFCLADADVVDDGGSGTLTGKVDVVGRFPEQDGSDTSWAASAGNRWDCVDECEAGNANDDTDYIQGFNYNTFKHSTAFVDGDDILAVGTTQRWAVVPNFGNSLQQAQKLSGTYRLSGFVANGTGTYVWFSILQSAVDPGGGAWSFTDANDIEWGVQNFVFDRRATACNLEVAYIAAVAAPSARRIFIT